ncbi:trehalase-like isoform X2 [Venturia canescens]|uniref:trehalase-like isoform X2 n=1 Tax=Venturia canescens TaxID=32260 RepID=UPI001C9BD097|nr:trehalase-like isoform X2 [Venturia canescens]
MEMDFPRVPYWMRNLPAAILTPEKVDYHHEIYCTGELLKTIQLTRIFNDSKTFVDHYQLNDPAVTLANFNKLMSETGGKPDREQIVRYVNENFAIEDELANWTLPDWQENPGILKRIEDRDFRSWVRDLNELWKFLAKKIGPETIANPQRHSLIPVDNGFIVPGGRFQEFYYWDSYWVIKGLLISGMRSTPRGMIENFLSMVSRFGFVPNGGRVYYLMRSQPPFLISMVETYLSYAFDMQFLIDNLPTLEKEFAYFHDEKTTDVVVGGKTYRMARYYVESDGPRPESYREDYELAQKLPPGTDHERFYEDVKAGAESGWDFSSRWFISADGGIGNLSQIETRNIIPVELNALLQKNARMLAKYNIMLGNDAKAKYYVSIAEEYQRGIDEVLWNEEEGIWLDWDMKNARHRNHFYPTNLSPLYTRSFDFSKASLYAAKAVVYLERNRIGDFMGGIPSSLLHTSEQWDFPNAWAPLQSIMVQGLRNTDAEPALSLARELATRWLRANFIGYTETGAMFEKYDAEVPGRYGGGGEYHVQTGFGWTNGVVIEFLDIYPNATSSDAL